MRRFSSIYKTTSASSFKGIMCNMADCWVSFPQYQCDGFTGLSTADTFVWWLILWFCFSFFLPFIFFRFSTPLILVLPSTNSLNSFPACLLHLSLVNLPFLVFINLLPLFLSQFIMLSRVPGFCLSVFFFCLNPFFKSFAHLEWLFVLTSKPLWFLYLIWIELYELFLWCLHLGPAPFYCVFRTY